MIKITGYPFILMRSPIQSISSAFQKWQMNHSRFELGVYLSSVELWNEYSKGGKLLLRDACKLERSLAKYWIRSSARPTPYGTFAGSLIVNVGEGDSQLVFNNVDHHHAKARLDMDYLYRIVMDLSFDDAIWKHLKFYPNNSLYELKDEYRYAEFDIRLPYRIYELTAVSKTHYLQMILEKSTEGKSIDELAHLLVESECVEYDDAFEYLRQLCISQVLVSELEPRITGVDPLEGLIATLSGLEVCSQLVKKLREIHAMLMSSVHSVDDVRRIEGLVTEAFPKVIVPKNAMQVDLFLSSAKASMDEKIVRRCLRQIEQLHVMSRDVDLPAMQLFKEKFIARFEGREVPLLVALDDNIGIGYAGFTDGSDLEDVLLREIGQHLYQKGEAGLDFIQKFVLNKYLAHVSEGTDCIEISDNDLESLSVQNKSKGKFPNSAAIMGSFIKKNGKFDEENFLFNLSYINGPSAANLLGRFTYWDTRLCELTKAILVDEESLNEDSIYAEIVHLPQSRIGNILIRPLLRGYEIPYVGRSGMSEDRQISLSDIVVSVRNGNVILFSRTLNKRIIPRMSTAHNFSTRSLPVYQFLCDMQFQNMKALAGWDWGMLNTQKKLPRVIYKNIILKKACWMVEESEFSEIPKSTVQQVEYFKDRFRGRGIPTKVEYGEGDNILYIDVENEVGVSIFVDILRKQKKLLLNEFLMTGENCIVKDVNGLPFSSEVVIPVSISSTPEAVFYSEAVDELNVQRSFLPNSKWLYFKIYCSSKFADRLIKEELREFVDNGLNNCTFERCFFIRYWDDGSHIRIRFYNTDVKKQFFLQHSFVEMLKPFVAGGDIYKVQVDTYLREIERYGASLIDATEILFSHDSVAVFRFLKLLVGDDMERYRLLFALRGIDSLLDVFCLKDSEKQVLLQTMQRAFFQEFHGDLKVQRLLNSSYRKHQRFIWSHLNNALDAEHQIEDGADIFNKRASDIQPIAEFIMSTLSRKGDSRKIFELLPQYIHMFMNRMFASNQRKHELIVYHYLEKYYASKLAQSVKRLNCI